MKFLKHAVSWGLLASAGTIAVSLPFAPIVVSAIGLLIAVVVFRWPALVFFVLPIVLTFPDLTPWTGRFYFNELDVFVLAALGAAVASLSFSPISRLQRIDVILLAAWIASCVLGMAMVLMRVDWSTEVTPNVYEHPLNAVRIAKASVYGTLFCFLLARTSVIYESAFRLFATGTLIGILFVVVQVLFERLRFVDIHDWENDFRATGPFAEMHIGGASLDAWLVMSIPFLACFWRDFDNYLSRAGVVVLTIAALAAVLATQSRAPLIIVVVQALFFAWISLRQPHQGFFRDRLPGLAVCSLVISLLVISVLAIPSIRVRFEQTPAAWKDRVEHWKRALADRGDDWPTVVFGSGPGTFSRVFQQTSNEGTGDYQFGSDAGQPFLRLRGTTPIYFGQHVTIEPDTSYEVIVTGRRNSQSGSLTVSLCEKNLLNSLEVSAVTGLFADTAFGKRETLNRTLESGNVGRIVGRGSGITVRRPVQFSFWASGGADLDIDEVQLIDSAGRNLLDNGDFSSGHDRWFWTSDEHPDWHALNIVVHLLIEQGWFGVTVFIAILFRILYRTVRRLKTDRNASVLLCAVLGFLMMGVIDSLLDSSRTGLQFWLLAAFALSVPETRRIGSGGQRRD